MRRLASFVLVALLIALPTSVVAQGGPKWRGSAGWGPRGAYGKLYDPVTVETLEGEVVSVERITPMKAMSPGIHATVKTDKETVSVHLGPSWFIESQDIKIEPKDQVEIKGSRVTIAGKPAIIAAEIKKGEETLTLRDEVGLPVWSATHRR